MIADLRSSIGSAEIDNTTFATMLIGLFAITAPIAGMPIFVAVTQGQTNTQARKTALLATITYVIICLIALFIGNIVLAIFGINVTALRVAGMSVVAVTGWHMMNAPSTLRAPAMCTAAASNERPAHLHASSNTWVEERPQPIIPAALVAGPAPISVAIMPLGFPIYAGPGTLSIVIAWGSGSRHVYVAAIGAILLNAVVILGLDLLAMPVTRIIGAQGLLVTQKLFGLIVVAIAVTGLASAFLILFPGLAGMPP